MALHSWASRYSKVVFTSFESFFGSPRSPDSSLQSIVSPRLISSVEFRIPHSPSDCTLWFKVSSGTVTHSAAFSRTVWARFLRFTSKPFKKIEGSRNWRWIKMNLAYDSEGRFAFSWPLAKWGSVVNWVNEHPNRLILYKYVWCEQWGLNKSPKVSRKVCTLNGWGGKIFRNEIEHLGSIDGKSKETNPYPKQHSKRIWR